MLIIKSAKLIQEHIEKLRMKGICIGFVPTMGALHEGHISIIRQSKREQQHTVASIFVNPTQFNNPSDFEKYPVTVENDIEMLEAAGCDTLFLPEVEEIYPPDFVKKFYDLGYLETILEGAFRPGHFQGVCLVVERLLRLIPAQVLYLGEKDYQQCMVVARMIELTGLNVQLKIAPTIRESTGLAMSSRNRRLTPDATKAALAIHEALTYLKNQLTTGTLNELIAFAENILLKNGFKIDYVSVTDQKLQLIDNWDGKTPLVGLIAATIHEVRLIDNMKLTGTD